jgi:iron complex outermembrane receptor protein
LNWLRRIIRASIVLGFLAFSAATASAQTPRTDWARASLEDLMNIEITTASRTERRADTTPAAVFVITQDDIRRSGLTTLPELFRLVPGMQVAQINSNDWAISARGFNDLWSNKLLVLVDGRSVYTRSFSGVLWSAQDLVLEDIDRIEVIRGPGGSVWGANAVNGVINIVTKSAVDTKGGLVRISDGTYDGRQGLARYGGTIGHMAYRVFSQWSDHNGSLTDRQTDAGDGWNRFTNGFRIDWSQGANSITTEGNFVTGGGHPLWTGFSGPTAALSFGPLHDATIDSGAVLGRWNRSGWSGGSLQVQSFADIHTRDDGNGVIERETVFDLDVQIQRKLAGRHEVVFGGGYRDADTTFDGVFGISANPNSSDNGVVNVFGQDEIAVSNRIQLTVGSKIERDSVSGWSVQPTIRVMTRVAPRQHVWAAVSRALRTPSALDLSINLKYAAFIGEGGLPVAVGLIGNPQYQPERLVSTEGGYRIDIGSTLAADITLFSGRYTGLPTQEPVAPVFESTPGTPHLFLSTQYRNLLDARTEGVEVAGHWTPWRSWRLDGSYSALQLTPSVDPSSQDAAASQFDGNAPAEQWQVHSSSWVMSRVQLDAGLFHVGRLRTLNVPAYTRVDARVEMKVSRSLSVIVVGQNLASRAHAEYAGPLAVTPTLIPRSLNAKLVWRF